MYVEPLPDDVCCSVIPVESKEKTDTVSENVKYIFPSSISMVNCSRRGLVTSGVYISTSLVVSLIGFLFMSSIPSCSILKYVVALEVAMLDRFLIWLESNDPI